jgi:threonyl-tRNA synthetase
MLVVGDKEIENKAVAVRTRRDSDVETKSINEFIEIIMDEIESKRI